MQHARIVLALEIQLTTNVLNVFLDMNLKLILKMIIIVMKIVPIIIILILQDNIIALILVQVITVN